MKTFAASIFAALILFVAPAALADGSNGSSTLTLTNPGTNVMGGVYVGPYTFTASTGGQQSQALLVCDDFKDDVFVGESWQAVTSTIPSLTNAQFSGLSQYEQVAYLTQQMFANSSNSQAQADIQWAIWDIFDPGVSSNDPYGTISAQDQSNIAGWLAAAQANAGNGNYADILLFTPIAGTQPPQSGPPQEYVTVTPEPGTLALFGIGLVVFGFIAKRRMNASPIRENMA
jgi:hypothetical protein